MFEEKKDVMTAKEAAMYLNISYWLITKLAKEKKIPHIRLGGKLIFRLSTLKKYLEEKEKESVSDTIEKEQ